ncbi:MAG: family 16 glycosylhydrolase [Akkermansia sp.]
MRLLLLFAALVSFLAPFCTAQEDAAAMRAAHPEWKLVFWDEFDGSSLNPNKWNRIEYLPGKVPDWRRYQSRDEELVTLNGDGTLSLWGKRGRYTSQDDPEGKAETYACGGIFTDKTFSFRYGYVEVRAKLRGARGAWPAIWMVPLKNDWPQSGGIDILERLHNEAGIYQTIHFNNAEGRHNSISTGGGGKARFSSEADMNEFHTYAMAWTKEAISFYMDGRETLRCPRQANNPNWPFSKGNKRFYLLLDMQLGGNWVGTIGDLGEGAEMQLDYVRVYAAPGMYNITKPAKKKRKRAPRR